MVTGCWAINKLLKKQAGSFQKWIWGGGINSSNQLIDLTTKQCHHRNKAMRGQAAGVETEKLGRSEIKCGVRSFVEN